MMMKARNYNRVNRKQQDKRRCVLCQKSEAYAVALQHNGCGTRIFGCISMYK